MYSIKGGVNIKRLYLKIPNIRFGITALLKKYRG